MSKESKFGLGIQAKLKHGALMTALDRRGWNQAQAARFLGIDNVRFGNWINMRVKPRNLNDETINKLYELTGQSPGELWPKEIFTPEFLQSPRMLRCIRKVPIHLLAAFGVIPALPAPQPDEIVEQKELSDLIQQIVERLPEQQRDIVRARFFEGETLETIAQRRKVTPERIRQIEKDAIRTLRYPSRNKQLVPYIK
jgi:RNA polymerase primary sigma factor